MKLSTPFRFINIIHKLGKQSRQEQNISLIQQLKDVYALRKLNGIEPKEYFIFGLEEAGLSFEDKSRFLSYNQACILHGRLNPHSERGVLDKLVFERYLNSFNIATPKVYGFFEQHLGQTAEGNHLRSKEDLRILFDHLPEKRFVIKPASSTKGKGITVIKQYNGNEFITPTGKKLNLDDLHQILLSVSDSSDKKVKNFALIQQYIEQHDDLAKIYSYSTNTMRIITFVTDNGEIEVLGAVLKFGRDNNEVDNMSRGGIASGVNKDGILGRCLPFNDIPLNYMDVHPNTGAQITGVKVPFYKEAVQLAIRAQRAIPRLRTIGWDIAITNEGVTILEGNCWWGHLTQINNRYGYITDNLKAALDKLDKPL